MWVNDDVRGWNITFNNNFFKITVDQKYSRFLWKTIKIDRFISFRRELSVMHSLRMCCKILCQNLQVHPKCMLGGNTKFHAFHVLPTHPTTPPPPSPEMEISAQDLTLKFWSRLLKVDCQPTSPPWEFGILAFLESASKFGCQPPCHPATYPPWTCKFGILAFLESESKVDCQPPPPPENENFGF